MFNNLKRLGFVPNLIIDVGASTGVWSRDMRLVYPDAEYWLFEPNPNYSISGFEHVFRVALGTRTTLYVPDVDQRSSTIPIEGADKLSVPTMRLDELVIDGYKNIILKLDTQGSELDILQSGITVLPYIDLIYTEVSLVNIFPSQEIPLFHDVVQFLAEHNFLLYDVNFRHTSPTGRVMQMDVTFVNQHEHIAALGGFEDWGYFK